MMKPVLKLAKEIGRCIPSHHHVELENRLAIAWGERKRNRFTGKPRSRAENLLASRENHARRCYLHVQDENYLLFLPFVLAYSPRACVGFKPKEFAEFRQYGGDKSQKDASTETKKLISTMAIRRGFNQNLNYLRFMETMFPKGSQEPEPIVETVDPTAAEPVGDEMQINRTGQEEELTLDNTGKQRTNPRGRLQVLKTPPKSNEEARQNSTASPAISTSCTNTPPNETQSGPAAAPKISLNNPNFTPLQRHLVLEKTSPQGIANIFDDYMCGAIRRDKILSDGITSQKAAVTMDFPPRGLVDCLMSLDVHQSKVGYLAMALFKVRVESIGQVRYISLKEGVRLTPNPEITLKGVLDEAVIDVFGPEIHGAITTCRMREKELEEGNRVTECVSMIITSSPSEAAIINLSLGLKGGVQIRNKLYT